jgi:outer membrane protein assembly factor BamC
MLKSKVVVTVALAGLMAGCSWLPSLTSLTQNKNADYKSQGEKIPTLEIPPDLTSPVVDDRFVIPDPKGSTTYSAYTRDRKAAPAPAAGSSVLPTIDSARIMRNGEYRWLSVKAAPDKAWPVVREFWKETGLQIAREVPEAGIIETDWAENRTKLPQDVVRNTVGRVFDGLFQTGERDKFRTRLEAGSTPGTTDVYISHRGLQEVLTSDKLSTVWQARASDPDLELEMLSRMAVKFGGNEKITPASTAVAGAAPAAGPAKAAYDTKAGGALTVNEPFDRAWRRVGLALDRIGFTVEDRDRSKGLFFVRYIDPDYEKYDKPSNSWYSWMFFWRKDPEQKKQYRIFVSEAAGASKVDVQTDDGKPDNNSPTAKRILSLLLEQLK